MCVCVCVCMYVCICMYVYMYMYVCMYIYIHTCIDLGAHGRCGKQTARVKGALQLLSNRHM